VTKEDDLLIDAVRTKATSRAELEKIGQRTCAEPASEIDVANAETALGFELDALLKRVYLEVADGGVGPGYGSQRLAGDGSLVKSYLSFLSGQWPDGLLPVWDWGDAIWSCVDLEGRIVTHDDVNGPILTTFTVTTWLQAWVGGVDLWRQMYEDKEATVINPFTKKPVTTKVRGRVKGLRWPGHDGNG